MDKNTTHADANLPPFNKGSSATHLPPIRRGSADTHLPPLKRGGRGGPSQSDSHRQSWRPQLAAVLGIAALLICGCGAPTTPTVKTPPPQPAAPPAPTAAANPPAATAPADVAEAGAVGTVAPELKGKFWFTADGKAPALKDKVYLVEFWSVT